MSAKDKATDAWFMGTERKERELADKAQTALFARRQRESVSRWRSASTWVAENLPDLVDADGEVCPFATYAAQDLKRITGAVPSTDQVRRYRRERWAHIREEEEVQP